MNELDKMASKYDAAEKRIEALKDERVGVFADFLQAQDENKDAKAAKLKAKLAEIDRDLELERDRVKALYSGMLAQAEKNLRDEMENYNFELEKLEADFEKNVQVLGQAIGTAKTLSGFLGFGELQNKIQDIFRDHIGNAKHFGSNSLLQHISAGSQLALEQFGDKDFQLRRSDLRSIQVLKSHPTSISDRSKKPVAAAILKVRRSGSE